MNSLPAAITKALDLGLTPTLINVCAWAKTYGVSTEQFRAEWDRQLSARSLKPANSFDEGGEK